MLGDAADVRRAIENVIGPEFGADGTRRYQSPLVYVISDAAMGDVKGPVRYRNAQGREIIVMSQSDWNAIEADPEVAAKLAHEFMAGWIALHNQQDGAEVIDGEEAHDMARMVEYIIFANMLNGPTPIIAHGINVNDNNVKALHQSVQNADRLIGQVAGELEYLEEIRENVRKEESQVDIERSLKGIENDGYSATEVPSMQDEFQLEVSLRNDLSPMVIGMIEHLEGQIAEAQTLEKGENAGTIDMQVEVLKKQVETLRNLGERIEGEALADGLMLLPEDEAQMFAQRPEGEARAMKYEELVARLNERMAKDRERRQRRREAGKPAPSEDFGFEGPAQEGGGITRRNFMKLFGLGAAQLMTSGNLLRSVYDLVGRDVSLDPDMEGAIRDFGGQWREVPAEQRGEMGVDYVGVSLEELLEEGLGHGAEARAGSPETQRNAMLIASRLRSAALQAIRDNVSSLPAGSSRSEVERAIYNAIKNTEAVAENVLRGLQASRDVGEIGAQLDSKIEQWKEVGQRRADMERKAAQVRQKRQLEKYAEKIELEQKAREEAKSKAEDEEKAKAEAEAEVRAKAEAEARAEDETTAQVNSLLPRISEREVQDELVGMGQSVVPTLEISLNTLGADRENIAIVLGRLGSQAAKDVLLDIISQEFYTQDMQLNAASALSGLELSENDINNLLDTLASSRASGAQLFGAARLFAENESARNQVQTAIKDQQRNAMMSAVIRQQPAELLNKIESRKAELASEREAATQRILESDASIEDLVRTELLEKFGMTSLPFVISNKAQLMEEVNKYYSAALLDEMIAGFRERPYVLSGGFVDRLGLLNERIKNTPRDSLYFRYENDYLWRMFGEASSFDMAENEVFLGKGAEFAKIIAEQVYSVFLEGRTFQEQMERLVDSEVNSAVTINFFSYLYDALGRGQELDYKGMGGIGDVPRSFYFRYGYINDAIFELREHFKNVAKEKGYISVLVLASMRGEEAFSFAELLSRATGCEVRVTAIEGSPGVVGQAREIQLIGDPIRIPTSKEVYTTKEGERIDTISVKSINSVTFRVASLGDKEFMDTLPSEGFDLVTANSVIEHMSDGLDTLLGTMVRVLAPGGIMTAHGSAGTGREAVFFRDNGVNERPDMPGIYQKSSVSGKSERGGISKQGNVFTHTDMNNTNGQLFSSWLVGVFTQEQLAQAVLFTDANGQIFYDIAALIGMASNGQKQELKARAKKLGIQIRTYRGSFVVIAEGIYSHCGRRTGMVWISRQSIRDKVRELEAAGFTGTQAELESLAISSLAAHEIAEKESVLQSAREMAAARDVQLGESPIDIINWLEGSDADGNLNVSDAEYNAMLDKAHEAAEAVEKQFTDRAVNAQASLRNESGEALAAMLKDAGLSARLARANSGWLLISRKKREEKAIPEA
ncbi:MAG: class I SAM-dependent methyltransferase [Candidatus Omnitrophota bacterium]